MRSLALGDPSMAGLSGTTAHWVVLSLLWSAGLVLVFAPLAVARYRRSCAGGVVGHDYTNGPIRRGAVGRPLRAGLAHRRHRGLGDLFSPDASYLPSPWAPPVEGLETIAGFWEDEREGPDEPFTMAHEVLAVDGTTAVVRVSVDYGQGTGPRPQRWRDLWVLRFDVDGRCAAFEEWSAPDSGTATSTRPDGRPASLAGGRRTCGLPAPRTRGRCRLPRPTPAKVRPRVAAVVEGPGGVGDDRERVVLRDRLQPAGHGLHRNERRGHERQREHPDETGRVRASTDPTDRPTSAWIQLKA